jgi:two-component system, chemotaxis family, response regulator PixG
MRSFERQHPCLVTMQRQLTEYLAKLKQEGFTGRLNISAAANQKFQVYFYLGRLLWADGGRHPNRSWQRHLKKYCPDINFNNLNLPTLERFEYWKYYLLTILYEENLCEKDKLIAFVKSRIYEIIFDVFFAEQEQNLEYRIEQIALPTLRERGFKSTITLIDIEDKVERVEREWQTWQENQFHYWHPDLVPSIADREKLDRSIYVNFSKKKVKETIDLVNGENSLRDIAVFRNIYLLELVYSLIPYIKEKSIELLETPDLLPIKTSTGSLLSKLFDEQNSESFVATNFKGFDYKPIVVCLDDDDRAINAIETIVEKCNYRFLAIRYPLQAVNIIFEYQPDLLFINGQFPDFDSYALIMKLRKIPQFKDLPIFLLSTNKCREDRLKSRIAGVNDIIEKPLKITHVFNAIEESLAYYSQFNTNITDIDERQKIEAIVALIARNL